MPDVTIIKYDPTFIAGMNVGQNCRSEFKVCIRVHSVQILHAATSAKKKKERFPVKKCDRGVIGTLCCNMKLRFQNEDALLKIYTGLDLYIFLK
jgi:hypothetical protein